MPTPGPNHSADDDSAFEMNEQSLPSISAWAHAFFESHRASKAVESVWLAIERSYLTRAAIDYLDFTTFCDALRGAPDKQSSTRLGDLVVLPDKALVYFFSDCEGAYEALKTFLEKEGIETRLKTPSTAPPTHLVFLGDSINRTSTALPFLELLRELDRRYPGHIHVLQGNHEGSVSHQKNLPLGFFQEIINHQFQVTTHEWRELLRDSRFGGAFREYIRGGGGEDFQVSAKNREILCAEYLRALKHQHLRWREHATDPSKGATKVDHSVIVDGAREKFAKYFLWDLHQLWFKTLPTMVVSSQLFAVHGMCPISGIFHPDELKKGTRCPTTLLHELSQVSRLPEDELSSTHLQDILWTDLDYSEPAVPDRETEPDIRPNPKRGRECMKVNESLVALFLRSIKRTPNLPDPIMIRGHQNAGPQGYTVTGHVHTIQSSLRSGGAVLKVALNGPGVLPSIERLSIR